MNPQSRPRNAAGLFVVVALLALVGVSHAAQAPATPGRLYVFLWFDTEDYVSPESDDAAKRIAAFLTQLGVRATFKVVGEKARALERRHRSDVIRALARHEIGYHSNTHSRHPTVAEYESTLDWGSGAEEFDRRERAGFDDLQRIFGQVPSCYGQPGNSWAPQPYVTLKRWGVNVYLDEGAHVGLNGKPFWYAGLLNIFDTVEGPELRPNADWSNLAEAKAKFQGFYLRAISRPEGGVLSLYFHPTEFVHREFWDAVNFARGANPPPEEWKQPPLNTPEVTERAFKYFEGLVATMKSFPQVEFVTASDGLGLFKDRAQNHAFSKKELGSIAGQATPEVAFQVHEEYALSTSEVFALLTEFVARVATGRSMEPMTLHGTPYGPSSVAPGLGPAQGPPLEVSWSQFSRTVQDVADFLEKRGRIPDVVWFGSTSAAPERYLVALARVSETLLVKGEPPERVVVPPARLAAAKYVADDSPRLWDWVIFPAGFHSEKLMKLAKLQSWTLKPARMYRGR